MKAARYVGRVGGLAVALGVGTAVFTGYGVASAETGSEGSASSSASSSASGSADSSGSESSGSANSSASADSSGSTGSSDDDADQDSSASNADDDSAAADDNDLSGELADVLADDDLDEDAADEEAGASGSGGSGSSGFDDADLAEAIADLDDEAAAAEDAVEDESSSSSVVSLASATLNPVADDETPAPAGTPVDLMLAAATRREVSGEPAATQKVTPPAQAAAEATSAGLFNNPITVAPVAPELNDGMLIGVIAAESSRGFELTYTVTGQPTDGSKTTLIPEAQCQASNCSTLFPDAPAGSGVFSLLPELSVVQSGGTSQFDVLISEVTDFDKFLEKLLGDTLGPLIVPPIVRFLQQVPIVGDLLAPLIGYSVKQTVTVDVGDLVPDGDPVAFTTDVISFDGTPISTNYFPDSEQSAGDPPAPTLLNGPGLSAAGTIDAFGPDIGNNPAIALPGINLVRTEGYNYVSWDPRGEHASGGVLQLDNPFFEGRDVKAIIDYLVASDLTATEGTTPSGAPDPVIGMFGGSYGGGIQLVVAGIDQRVDAIAPGIAWNSLNEALYPESSFKTGWANVLYTALESINADINSQIPTAILTGNLFSVVSESAQAVLSSAGPTVLVESITAPTLLIQGTADGLFVLEQSIQNGEIVDVNGVQTEMIWFCGGHGICRNPTNPAQNDVVVNATMDWLDRFVKGETVPEGPSFQWFDQLAGHFTAELYPFEDGFAGPTIDVPGEGGFLPIIPYLGGSGPLGVPLVGPTIATEAWNALNVSITTPAEETLLVGAPELTFTYSGLGNADFIYGQIVDESTGLVLGNLVKPIPVTLDGRTQTVTADLENIVYTAPGSDNLTLQLTGFATPYSNWTAWGGIHVSDIELKLPTVAPGVATPVMT
ncbi:MAG: peptidase S15 [Actinomycetia bacterium]|nr:peptidase S15 [Actinomycetes bacterium]